MFEYHIEPLVIVSVHKLINDLLTYLLINCIYNTAKLCICSIYPGALTLGWVTERKGHLAC